MNRTAILEVGMLTQCYDRRCLHPITEPDFISASRLLGRIAEATPGDTVRARARDVHMRWRADDGVISTLGESVARRHPLVILVCDEKED